MEYLILSIIGFLAAITPGPDIFYVLRQSLCNGKIASLWAVFGILSGNIVYLTLVGIGLGIIGKNLYFQLVVGLLGGIYLLNIALSIFKEKPSLNKSCSKLDGLKIYKEALFLNLSNPKAMIFFAVIVTPFMAGSTFFSLLTLFIGISFAFITVAFLASIIDIKESVLLIINKLASILFLFFSIGLFISAYRAYSML
jgi:threonine/homoserine/homoserine lactone efflux protein